MPNHIAMRNLKYAIQMTVHSNCAIRVTHRDVNLRTHGPKYRHLNDNSNCAIQMIIQMIIQIAHFCSRVKTVSVNLTF